MEKIIRRKVTSDDLVAKHGRTDENQCDVTVIINDGIATKSDPDDTQTHEVVQVLESERKNTNKEEHVDKNK